jgi:hypothetical protein
MSGAIADGVVGPLPKVGAETDLHDVIRAVVEARKGDLADGSVTIEGKVEQARAPRRLVSKPRLSAALLNTPCRVASGQRRTGAAKRSRSNDKRESHSPVRARSPSAAGSRQSASTA